MSEDSAENRRTREDERTAEHGMGGGTPNTGLNDEML